MKVDKRLTQRKEVDRQTDRQAGRDRETHIRRGKGARERAGWGWGGG